MGEKKKQLANRKRTETSKEKNALQQITRPNCEVQYLMDSESVGEYIITEEREVVETIIYRHSARKESCENGGTGAR